MKKYRTLLLIGIDIAIFVGIYIGCSFLNSIVHPDRNLTTATYIISGLWFLALPMLLRFVLRVYSNVWRYANSAAYLKMLISDCTGGVVAVFSAAGMGLNDGLVLNSLIITMFSLISLATRFLYQQYYRHLNVSLADINKIGVCIVGAGQLGSLLAEELLYNSASHYRPICFVDRDVAKVGGRVCGLKVYPEGEELIEQLKALPIQEIFLALPSIDGDTAAKLYNYYSQTGCKVKLYDYPLRNMTGEPADGRRMLREIRIEDLLFRRSLEINDSSSLEFYRDKTVLVTGGGGSIGSELCRQIAKLSPRRLVVLDIYENNAYEIQQELSRRYGDTLSLSVEIGSVRDRARLEEIFATYRPDVVFHAAAHKHVPLMEHSSAEVIKNNILGTYNTADMAEKYGTGKFILISTDKAVNPTNVMGASKRMCEMLIECRCDSKTTFAAVRFGNVLGSNGSVIPLFRKQIAEGGPITITDKRIIRYFMTIPEAAQLVMQAGTMAKAGELFVLDMGKPVKILDLAENMIRLSGLRPYEDIEIREIGLREGEKLYEELLIATEKLTRTENKMIFIEHDEPLSRREIDERLQYLSNVLKETEGAAAPERIKAAIREVVPTYRDPAEVNREAESAKEMKEVASMGPKT